MRSIKPVVALALWLAPVALNAESFGGSAEVIDGDSFIVDGREVRLFGIDALELSQICQINGVDWRCGEEAKHTLEALVLGNRVDCSADDVDMHGRLLAVCHAGGLTLNEAMVDYGWAVAYREYSSDYVGNEFRAKAARAGIWKSNFILPSEYRHGQNRFEEEREQRREAQPQARAQQAEQYGCVIKGNRSRRGEWIYHMPGMPYYNVTRAEETFCTEAAARAAGYRRAIVR